MEGNLMPQKLPRPQKQGRDPEAWLKDALKWSRRNRRKVILMIEKGHKDAGNSKLHFDHPV